MSLSPQFLDELKLRVDLAALIGRRVKLTKRAFWLDRRYPIVNRWRDPS